MLVYIDIETIPSARNDVRARFHDEALEHARSAAPPANYKKPEIIADWRERQLADAAEKADADWRKTSFDGGYGELVCIGWAVEGSKVEHVARPTVEVSEAAVLGEFFEQIATDRSVTFVGHNVGFDLRFLHHRAAVLRVRPSVYIPYNAAAYQGRYLDTMFLWAGLRDSVKLTVLCDILGIEVHDEIDGAGVWDAFQAGRIDQIVEHCIADVERVREVYRRITFAD